MDRKEEWIYKSLLLQISQIGIQRARMLIESVGSAKQVFSLSFKELLQIENIGEIAARNLIHHPKNTTPFEKEWDRLQQLQIDIIHYEDEEYPILLKECFDAPLFLYKKGNTSLIQNRFLSIVGTRNPSEYARKITQQIVEQIAPYKPTIVSGMALGIDALAHQQALKNGLTTFAVLGTGLDVIYPSINLSLSKQIEQQGALLSEFPLGTIPDRMNFPQRNRIVAGMCEATLVIETALKGGSMITAALSNSYDRELFSIPYKIGETKGEGNLWLIKKNMAKLIISGEDIAESLGWNNIPKSKPIQTQLFDFTEDERTLFQLIQQEEKIHIDTLMLKTTLPKEKIPQLLLEMELKGMIQSLPGKMFSIV